MVLRTLEAVGLLIHGYKQEWAELRKLIAAPTFISTVVNFDGYSVKFVLFSAPTLLRRFEQVLRIIISLISRSILRLCVVAAKYGTSTKTYINRLVEHFLNGLLPKCNSLTS